MHILPAIFMASSAICRAGKLRYAPPAPAPQPARRAAAADGRTAAVRLNHVALTAEQERLFLVADQQQRFQMPQELVGAPVLGQFHRAPAKVAMILLELGLEAAEQGKRIGRRPGKSSQNLVLYKRRIFLAVCLITASPSVTWPSPASTTCRRVAPTKLSWIESVASYSHERNF
jgi:hypothetical protein